MIRTIFATDQDFDRWDTFVAAHPDGTVFHTTRWVMDDPETRPELLFMMKDDELVGGFAFGVNSRFGLKRIIKTSLTARFSPLVSAEFAESERVEIYRTLFRALRPFDLAGFTTTNEKEAGLMMRAGAKANGIYPTHFKVPSENPDALLESYQPALRRNIRHALAEGGGYVEEADFDEAYHLFTLAYSSRGAEPRFSKDRFEEVYTRMRLSGEAALPGVLDKNGILVGALLLFYDQKTVYYMVSGTERDALGGNTGALLVHFALRFAQDRGLNFDFNGSSITGINQFFEKFRPDTDANVYHLKISGSVKGRLAETAARLAGKSII